MSTLQELRRAKYPTIKAFAEAMNVSASKASQILQGAYTADDLVVKQVCSLLGIDLSTCIDAMCEAREEADRRWKEKHPPTKTQEQWQAELTAYVDEQWAKMSDAQKRLVHEQAVELGIAREQRSPIEIMIDRAVGRE